MSEDIIEKIDATLLAEANSKRFDPLGPDWDSTVWDRTLQADSVRSRPGSEEESEPVDAASGLLVVALAEALVELGPAVTRALDGLVGAPADPVADAMPLRQGHTTREIDGVRPEYRDGLWSTVDAFDNGVEYVDTFTDSSGNGWTVIDESHVFTLDNSADAEETIPIYVNVGGRHVTRTVWAGPWVREHRMTTEPIDAEEADEPEPWVVSRCTVHPMGFGCEASQPTCRREFIRLNPPVVGHFDAGSAPHE